jgi:hypothetical protein
MSAKREFQEYVHSINLQSYSETFRYALELAMSAGEEKFQSIPNWWGTEEDDKPSNEVLAIIVQEAAKGDVDPAAQELSVTVDGQPGEGSPKFKKKILIECVDKVVTDWTSDRLGRVPLVTKKGVKHAVIAFPLSGDVGERIKNMIGLPKCYESTQPQWQTLASGKAELVATITNAGHFTGAHIDNPALQADVYHIFGRKLWFLWEDSDHNMEKVMARTIEYDDIDLEWCFKNLTGLKVPQFLP